MLQLKGTKDFHGARRETWLRENVSIERGWVTTSEKRRDWLFVQEHRDMSREGVLSYERLNNLGAHATELDLTRLHFTSLLSPELPELHSYNLNLMPHFTRRLTFYRLPFELCFTNQDHIWT